MQFPSGRRTVTTVKFIPRKNDTINTTDLFQMLRMQIFRLSRHLSRELNMYHSGSVIRERLCLKKILVKKLMIKLITPNKFQIG